MQNILLVVIVILLIAIYSKKNISNKIVKELKENEELNIHDNSLVKDKDKKFIKSDLELLFYLTDEQKKAFELPEKDLLPSKMKTIFRQKYLEDSLKDSTSNIYKAIEYIKENGIKIQRSSKIELEHFPTLMEQYKEFLNQSKFINKIDVINSLNMIKVNARTVDDNKLFFLSQFTKLIYTNKLTFKDLEIHTDLYGYGPSEVNFILFNIENVREIKDGGDYKIFEADVLFTLKDKSKKILKYEFYDDTLEEFQMWSKEFVYGFDEEDCYHYYSYHNKQKNELKIVLDDLFQYIDYVGKHFYNKEFIKWNFLRYDFESLLTNDYGEYIDKSWQIDKKNFKYVDEIEQKDDIDIIDSMTDNELFVYALNLYYKEYSNFELKEKIFQVVKYLDKLIENNYPMAYLVKGLLHLDGKIVLRDLSAANFYLHKAYDLGLQTPILLIWNENDLYQNSK